MSPYLKGLVAVDFSLRHYLTMAPVEAIGILRNGRNAAFGFSTTVPTVTPEAILGAVIIGLFVAKFHLLISQIKHGYLMKI